VSRSKLPPRAGSAGGRAEDDAIVAVRLLRPIHAQGIRLEAGRRIGAPRDWATHLIINGVAESARKPRPPYSIHEITGEFIRPLTDSETAAMLKRTVERAVDPDYPDEVRERESFAFRHGRSPSQRATTDDVAAWKRANEEQLIPNRLAREARRLAAIEDTPEHADGVILLAEAGRGWQRVGDEALPRSLRIAAGDKLLADLDHLVDVTHAGLRRLAHRSAQREADAKARGARQAGADATNRKKREAAEARKKKFDDEAAELIMNGRPARDVNALLAKRHGVTTRQIGYIRQGPNATKRKPR
jgi:hypothetical protein